LTIEPGAPGAVPPAQARRSGGLEALEKVIRQFTGVMNWVGGIALGAMLLLVFIDVAGSKLLPEIAKLFGVYLAPGPVPGGIQLVGFLAILVAAFPIAYTQWKRGHIEVEFFVEKMPRVPREIVYGIVTLLGLALFIILAWQSYELGRSLQLSGEVSMTRGIPFYPFIYALAFCCLPVCLVLVAQFLKIVLGVMRR
jgi:TRAP-type C4-dicarboxylate transport system permease small subunit